MLTIKIIYIIIIIIKIIIVITEYYNNISYTINSIPTDSVFVIKNILNPKTFDNIKNIILSNYNNNIFRHNNIIRNGASISYQNIKSSKLKDILPNILTKELLSKIKKETGIKANFIPITDPNIVSILVYDKPTDGIKWHYDGNYFYGNRWTCILTIVNKKNNKNETGYSSAKLVYKKQGKVYKIASPENSLIIFNGSHVLHKVEPIKNNETRIVISLVLCDVCKYNINPITKLRNYIVNKSFYG